jgi:hypothetical protein
MILVVQRAKIETQERRAKDSGSSFRGKALAASLDTDQQNAFRRVQMCGVGFATKSRFAPG